MGYGASMDLWRVVVGWTVVVAFVVLMVWSMGQPDATTGETIPQSTNYAGS
jgi:hypothetical protein